MLLNFVRVALVLCIIPALCCGQSTFNAATMCTLVPNGTFINNPTTCNSWAQCVDEIPIAGTCAGDLFYDVQTNSCVSSSNYTCLSSNPCAATPNGFVSDPYSCNGYYYCSNGVGAHGTCSSGMNYNPGTQSCIRNFPCEVGMDPDSYCNIVAQGVFIQNTSSCNGWEMCWNGELMYGTCPGNFYYNAFEGVCDYPEDVTCTVQTTTVPTPSGTDVCPYAGAFISDNSTCNGYYYCHGTSNGDIELQHGECPAGRFFSPENGGECVDRTQVVCNYDRCAGMGATYIQLANESDDDCQGYAVCQYGVTIGSGYCPDGTYFNELTQLCTTAVVSYPACALSGETTTTTATASTESTETTDTTDTTDTTETTEIAETTEMIDTTEEPITSIKV